VRLPVPALRDRDPDELRDPDEFRDPDEARDPEELRDEDEFRDEDELRDDEEDLDAEDDRPPERDGLARWSRGTSSLTSALTSRGSSADKNFAIRSSSRRVRLASCAVSRSPTSLAKVSMRV
jgi:hypothetical protein